MTIAARRPEKLRRRPPRGSRARASTCRRSRRTSPRRRTSRRSSSPIASATGGWTCSSTTPASASGRPSGEIQTKHLDMQLDINLRSIVAVLPRMPGDAREPPPPSTTTRSSSTPPRSPASAAWAGTSVYSATKHGVVGWTEAMNKRAERRGHQVNGAVPRLRGHADDRLRQGARPRRGDDPARGHRRGRALPAEGLPRVRRPGDHVHPTRRGAL